MAYALHVQTRRQISEMGKQMLDGFEYKLTCSVIDPSRFRGRQIGSVLHYENKVKPCLTEFKKSFCPGLRFWPAFGRDHIGPKLSGELRPRMRGKLKTCNRNRMRIL